METLLHRHTPYRGGRLTGGRTRRPRPASCAPRRAGHPPPRPVISGCFVSSGFQRNFRLMVGPPSQFAFSIGCKPVCQSNRCRFLNAWWSWPLHATRAVMPRNVAWSRFEASHSMVNVAERGARHGMTWRETASGLAPLLTHPMRFCPRGLRAYHYRPPCFPSLLLSPRPSSTSETAVPRLSTSPFRGLSEV